MHSPGNSLLDALLGSLSRPPKPRVFVSYHHGNDQGWYDLFAQAFGGSFDVFTDTSLERRVDSDDADYIRRVIREQNITGSSMTVVLCGPETWKRRWVDWEIQMTLNKEHGLLGIALPTCARNLQGQCIVPDRLSDNIQSGYAGWITWPADSQTLRDAIWYARELSLLSLNIRNSRPAMQRSRP